MECDLSLCCAETQAGDSNVECLPDRSSFPHWHCPLWLTHTLASHRWFGFMTMMIKNVKIMLIDSEGYDEASWATPTPIPCDPNKPFLWKEQLSFSRKIYILSPRCQIRPNMCPAPKYGAYQLIPDCLDGLVGGWVAACGFLGQLHWY